MSIVPKAIPVAKKVAIVLPQDLEKEIKGFISSLRDVKKTGSSLLDSDVFFGNDKEGFLFLSGEESKIYKEKAKALIQALCKSELLSAEEVGKLFNTAILETLDINSQRADQTFEQRLDIALSNFKGVLSTGFQKFCIYYPVLGLAPDGLPFAVGNIEFALFQEQYLKELELIPGEQPDDAKRKYAETIVQDIKEMGFWEKPYVKVVASAYDEKSARRNALREIRACLEILNFYSDLIPYTKGFMYLHGDASHAKIITPLKNIDGKPHRSILYGSAGPFDDVSLHSLLQTEKKDGMGFTKVLQLMSESRNEYGEKLLTSLRWAGKATVLAYQDRKEDAFLLYTISLESIILPDRGDESTYRLSLRLAHLMATGAEHRPGIAKQVRDLYGTRSAIVHSGNFEVKDRELSLMRFIVKNSLVHLLRDEPFSKMNSQSELMLWFDKQIFE